MNLLFLGVIGYLVDKIIWSQLFLFSQTDSPVDVCLQSWMNNKENKVIFYMLPISRVLLGE